MSFCGFLGRARLPGYRFVINARGVATVVEDQSREVYGVLWNITLDDEKALDKYEGFSGAHTRR
jgi:hypothetical protein